MLIILWCSGGVAFWLGVLLAQINGYPFQLLKSTGLALALALIQGAVLKRLAWGREVGGGLVLGIIPLFLGFYGQSGHWASEVLILGFLVSLSVVNALLACRWHQEWQSIVKNPSASLPGGAPRALIFTLLNILVIIGLLFIWYFPATPLPGRDGAWVLAAAAIVNQELIKRKFYASSQGSQTLSRTAVGFHFLFIAWLGLILVLRSIG